MTSLTSGTKLGPYEVLTAIGAGEWAGVSWNGYATRSSSRNQILPLHLSSDPDLKQRFERETHSISSLSHPHICALYDIGHQDGIDYLVWSPTGRRYIRRAIEQSAVPNDQVLAMECKLPMHSIKLQLQIVHGI